MPYRICSSQYVIKQWLLLPFPNQKKLFSHEIPKEHGSPSIVRKAYIALGSNLGDRIRNIETACHELNRNGLQVLRTSSLYETAPMYVEDQASFVNGVCEASGS